MNLSTYSEVKFRPIFTGLLSRVPGLYEWWDRQRPVGNTASPEYCRSIWRFHLNNVTNESGGVAPRSCGELGPGVSLGCSIAAILDGVEQAVAFDAGHYASYEANLAVLKALAGNESTKAEVQKLERAIECIASGRPQTELRYAAPWTDPSVCPADSLDMIFSHSVLEHVADPHATYLACFKWLKPGGYMSHKIDHSAHGITRSWNGHYTIPTWLWRVIYGRRPFLLNRIRPSEHLAALQSAGFTILESSAFVVGEHAMNEVSLADFPRDDRLIRTSTLVVRKPP